MSSSPVVALPQGESTAGTRKRRSRVFQYWAVALGILPVVLIYAASFLPFHFSAIQPDSAAVLMPPSATHWFGTDDSGFDIFSRTFTAARLDLPLAIGSTILAMVIGVPLGLAAANEGAASNVIMRIVDALQALPLLIVAVAIVSLSGRNIVNVIFAIVLVSAPGFIRLVRSGAQVVRTSRFVEAARTIGASRSRVLFVHILPNVMGLVLAQFTLGIGVALVTIAGLNFLGVGIAPPTPSWGSMIADGAGVVTEGAWWVALFPSLAIVIVISTLNVAARSLEDLTKAR